MTSCLYQKHFTSLLVNAMFRLPHPRGGDSQDQEKLLAPSADRQTRNYDTEFSKHHHSISTLRSKRLSFNKMKWGATDTKIFE